MSFQIFFFIAFFQNILKIVVYKFSLPILKINRYTIIIYIITFYFAFINNVLFDYLRNKNSKIYLLIYLTIVHIL